MCYYFVDMLVIYTWSCYNYAIHIEEKSLQGMVQSHTDGVYLLVVKCDLLRFQSR